MIKKNSKIFVAGHKGLVGSAVVRILKKEGYTNILTATKKKLDLIDQKKTFKFLKKQKPDFIFMCAAKVGGILANDQFKGDFIYQNLQIQTNIIHGALKANVKNLSGPLSIAQFSGKSLEMGLSYFLYLLAILSVSLGVLNLLPIPMLDGGHLVYYSY